MQKIYAILHFDNEQGVKMCNPNQSINNLYNSCDSKDQEWQGIQMHKNAQFLYKV